MTPENDPVELVNKLNTLLVNVPVSIDTLENWEYELRTTRLQVISTAGDTVETSKADSLIQKARELLAVYAELKKKQNKIDSNKNDPLELNFLVKEYSTQISILVNFKARDENIFPFIVKKLLEDAQLALSEAEGAKKKMGLILGVLVTQLAVGDKVKVLDEIDRLFNQEGVNHFPRGDGSDDFETYSQARSRITGELFNGTRGKIIEHLVKAEKIAGDPPGNFQPKTDAELDDIHYELTRLDVMFETKYIQSDLGKETELMDRIKPIRARVSTLLDQRQSTKKTLENLGDISTPDLIMDKLTTLFHASYRLLPNLENKIGELRVRYRTAKTREIKDFLVKVDNKCTAREYDSLLNDLNKLKSDLEAVNPPNQEYVQIEDLVKLINDSIDRVTTERNLWGEFVKLRDQLTPFITQGQVDKSVQNRLSDHENLADWRRQFKTQLMDLESALNSQAAEANTIEEVRDLYRKDPSDNQIVTLLSQENIKKENAIPITSPFYNEAKAYKRACECHILAKNVRVACSNANVIQKDTQGWIAGIQKELVVFENTSQELLLTDFSLLPAAARLIDTQVKNLINSLKKLQDQAQDLFTLWVQVTAQKAVGYEKGWEVLLAKVSYPWEKELSESIQSLRSAFQTEWRAAHLTKIASLTSSLTPGRDQLNEAYRLVKELDKYNLLVQSGDLERREDVISKYHLYYLKEMLGTQKPLEDYDENDFIGIGKKINLNWDVLITHLDALTGLSSFTGNQIIIIARLRILALSHAGLIYDRQKSMIRLEAELPKMASMEDADSIYVALVMRCLEDPTDYKQASDLVFQLKKINQRTQQVGDALSKLIDAHNKQRGEDISAAVQDLTTGLAALKKLLPALEPALEESLNVKVSSWFSMYAEHALTETAMITNGYKKRNNCSEDQFFKVYSYLNEVHAYAGNDLRYIEGRNFLDKFAATIGASILTKVNNLQSDAKQTLKEKVRVAEQMAGYLFIVFGEGSSSAPNSDSWAELGGLYTTFPEDVKNWKRALEEFEKLRKVLRDLLSSDATWTWNSSNQRVSPLSELIIINTGVQKVNEWLGSYQPPEWTDFNKFLADFRNCNTTLATQMQQLVRYVNNEDYENAILLQKDLRAKRDDWQLKLDAGVAAGLGDGISLDIDHYYRIENSNDRIEKTLGNWRVLGKGEPVRGLTQIKSHLQNLENNRKDWLARKEKLVSLSANLFKFLKDAHKSVGPNSGQLSKAANLCRETPPAELKKYEDSEKRNVIPKTIQSLAALDSELEKATPPLTMCALKAGAPGVDDDFSPGFKSQGLTQAWEDLVNIEEYLNKFELNTKWRDYLVQLIGCAMLDCGLQEDLLEDYSGMQKRIVGTTLDKQVEIINEVIEKKTEDLKRIINDITRHIDRHSRAVIVARGPLNVLRDMLEKAESIDKEAPRVVGARKFYDNQETILLSGGGRNNR